MAQNMRNCANCTLFTANSKAERQAHVETHAVLAIRAQRIFVCPRCGGTACDAMTLANHLRSACMPNAGQVMINVALGFAQHPNPSMANHPYAYLVTAGGQNAVNQQLVLPVPPQATALVVPVQGAAAALQAAINVRTNGTLSNQSSHGTAPTPPATQTPTVQASAFQAPVARAQAFQPPTPRAPAFQAPYNGRAPFPRAPAPAASAPQAQTSRSSSPQVSAGNGPAHGGASRPMRSFATRRSRPSLAARLNGGWARGDRITAEEFEADKEAASDFDEDEDSTTTQAQGQLSRIPADVPADLTHGPCCLLYAYMGVSHSQGCRGTVSESHTSAGEGARTRPSVEEATGTAFGGQPVQQDLAEANHNSDGSHENGSLAQSEASTDALLDACFHCHEFGHDHDNCPEQQGH